VRRWCRYGRSRSAASAAPTPDGDVDPGRAQPVVTPARHPRVGVLQRADHPGHAGVDQRVGAGTRPAVVGARFGASRRPWHRGPPSAARSASTSACGPPGNRSRPHRSAHPSGRRSRNRPRGWGRCGAGRWWPRPPHGASRRGRCRCRGRRGRRATEHRRARAARRARRARRARHARCARPSRLARFASGRNGVPAGRSRWGASRRRRGRVRPGRAVPLLHPPIRTLTVGPGLPPGRPWLAARGSRTSVTRSHPGSTVTPVGTSTAPEGFFSTVAGQVNTRGRQLPLCDVRHERTSSRMAGAVASSAPRTAGRLSGRHAAGPGHLRPVGPLGRRRRAPGLTGLLRRELDGARRSDSGTPSTSAGANGRPSRRRRSRRSSRRVTSRSTTAAASVGSRSSDAGTGAGRRGSPAPDPEHARIRARMRAIWALTACASGPRPNSRSAARIQP